MLLRENIYLLESFGAVVPAEKPVHSDEGGRAAKMSERTVGASVGVLDTRLVELRLDAKLCDGER